MKGDIVFTVAKKCKRSAVTVVGPQIFLFFLVCVGDIFTQRQGERMDVAVANGMLEAAEKAGIEGRIFITHPSMKGAHVVSADPPFSEG